jgi:hypothetical protein
MERPHDGAALGRSLKKELVVNIVGDPVQIHNIAGWDLFEHRAAEWRPSVTEQF